MISLVDTLFPELVKRGMQYLYYKGGPETAPEAHGLELRELRKRVAEQLERRAN